MQILNEFSHLLGCESFRSCAQITTLNYKSWNDSMPNRAVIKAKLSQPQKITNMLRRHRRKTLDLNLSERCLQHDVIPLHLLLESFGKRYRLRRRNRTQDDIFDFDSLLSQLMGIG